MKVKLINYILSVIFLATIISCGTINQNVYKGMALTKISAEQIASTAKQMNKDGKITSDQLAKVQDAYNKGQKANSAIIEAFKISLDAGSKNPMNDSTVQSAMNEFNKIMQSLVDIAISFNIIKSGQ